MKNRKGFTITELVIVIAVIAILAAVLIPTFSSIIGKAQASKNLQEARNMMINYIAANNGAVADEYYIQVGEGNAAVYFKVLGGQLQETTVAAPVAGKILVTKDDTTDTDDFPQSATYTTVAAG